MILEEVLLQLLTTDAPADIESKINGHIHFGVIKKHSHTYLRITNTNNPQSERTSTGHQHTIKNSTFQIDVFAKTYLSAQELAQQIASHLDAYQNDHSDLVIELIEVENIRPGYANTNEIHQHIIDLAITHRREPE
tara:strand:- start:10228 stop:10635 length:408 start_codon:yes stop_codon:yes gene_type:complete